MAQVGEGGSVGPLISSPRLPSRSTIASNHVLFGQLVGARFNIPPLDGLRPHQIQDFHGAHLAVAGVEQKSSPSRPDAARPPFGPLKGILASRVADRGAGHGEHIGRRTRFIQATGMWRPPGGRPVARRENSRPHGRSISALAVVRIWRLGGAGLRGGKKRGEVRRLETLFVESQVEGEETDPFATLGPGGRDQARTYHHISTNTAPPA